MTRPPVAVAAADTAADTVVVAAAAVDTDAGTVADSPGRDW